MPGAGMSMWVLAGVVWWLAAVALSFPYRRRNAAWLRWVRPTLGLPLALGCLLEKGRACWLGNLCRRGVRLRPGVTPVPYRGFRPFELGLVVAVLIAVGAGCLFG